MDTGETVDSRTVFLLLLFGCSVRSSMPAVSAGSSGSEMTRAGTPTDNAAMEAINGWIKAELFMDLHVAGENRLTKKLMNTLNSSMNSDQLIPLDI